MPVLRHRRFQRRPWTAAALLTGLLAALLLPGGRAGAADAPEHRALRPDLRGTAVAWGGNGYGQLGDGTTVGDSTTPTPVCGAAPCTAPLAEVVSVAAGLLHSIALRSDGTVLAWGYNHEGELGDGTGHDRITPTRVCDVGQTAPCSSYLHDVVAVAAGDWHSLALLADGSIVAWGLNSSGQLGDGTTDNRAVPVLTGAANAVAVSAGADHSMALGTDGFVLTWGDNGHGQLGDGSTTDRTRPYAVCLDDFCDPRDQVIAIAGGGDRSVALRREGTVMAWGENTVGQLGDGTTVDRGLPVWVCATGATAPCGSAGTVLGGITAIAAGVGHTVALRSDGTLRAWGGNGFGQLGDGTYTSRSTPVRVCAGNTTAPCGTFQSGISAIAAGFEFSVALRSDGGVRAWGNNDHGQLGDGTAQYRNTPVRVCAPGRTTPCETPLGGVGAIAAGRDHTLAVVRS
ncbi:RCC1-like domain-containing protein [Kitasatospora purpeofusca]|uniref:RCC1-like domain-containing protein n=1 Tax=Kitasatospora purpeofusca TaxID=67352 RepID=UPI003F4AB969